MRVKDLIETCQDFDRINIWESNNDDPISYDPTDTTEIYSVEVIKAIPDNILNTTVQAWYMTQNILTIYI